MLKLRSEYINAKVHEMLINTYCPSWLLESAVKQRCVVSAAMTSGVEAPTPAGGRLGAGAGGSPFYRELWFIVLMAGVALVLLALILALALHKALNKPPFTRERPPLVPLPLHRRSPLTNFPTSNSYLVIFRRKYTSCHLPIAQLHSDKSWTLLLLRALTCFKGQELY